eukprot:SAG31_NODE_3321_length_4417_cov_2.056508_4_plen_75_part_00
MQMTPSAEPYQSQSQRGLVPLLEVAALFREMREQWTAEMKAEQREKKREQQELAAQFAPQEAYVATITHHNANI